MTTYEYLRMQDDATLIQLAQELNKTTYPEDGLVRKTVTAMYGDSPMVIIKALGMSIVLNQVLAERLESMKDLVASLEDPLAD